MAPGPESCHHIADYDVQFSLIVGLHGSADHRVFFLFLRQISSASPAYTDEEMRWAEGGKYPAFIMLHSFP